MSQTFSCAKQRNETTIKALPKNKERILLSSNHHQQSCSLNDIFPTIRLTSFIRSFTNAFCPQNRHAGCAIIFLFLNGLVSAIIGIGIRKKTPKFPICSVCFLLLYASLAYLIETTIWKSWYWQATESVWDIAWNGRFISDAVFNHSNLAE